MLEAVAVVDHRQVTMREGAELLVGVEGACGPVPKELALDGQPDGAGGGPALRDGVGEIVEDGAEKPGADDTIHPRP